MTADVGINSVATGCELTTTDDTRSNLITRFREFDCKNDSVFVEGWLQLRATFDSSILEDQLAQQFLSAKIFYFSRKYCLSHNEREELEKSLFESGSAELDSISHKPEPPVDKENVEINSATQGHTNTKWDKDAQLQPTELSAPQCDEPHYPTSFEDIVRCIRNGEPLPGVENITVEATDQSIPECVQMPPKKPWEN